MTGFPAGKNFVHRSYPCDQVRLTFCPEIPVTHDVTLGQKHHVTSMFSTRSTTAANAAEDQELVNLSAIVTRSK